MIKEIRYVNPQYKLTLRKYNVINIMLSHSACECGTILIETSLLHELFPVGLEDAFAKRKWGTEVVDFGVPYDFESIMHYPFTAFSKDGKPTIRNIVPMNGKVPYVELSDGDAKQTNAMYKCNGKEV